MPTPGGPVTVDPMDTHEQNGADGDTVATMPSHDTTSDRVDIACALASAIDAGDVDDFIGFREWYTGQLPGSAHSWPEIQTVLAQHRAGRRCTGEPSRRHSGPRRGNIFEPEFETDTGGLDVREFSYTDVHLTPAARERFTGSTLAQRILLGCAVRHGTYRPGRDEAHLVAYGAHRFILSADAAVAISYQEADTARPRRGAGAPVATHTLDEVGFDAATVAIRDRVIEAFSNKHGTDDQEAEEEIRAFLDDTLARHKHRVARNGCHVFAADGYTVWVAPDGAEVTKYETLHIERTPGDVRNGVPSRFGRGSRDD